MLVVPLFICVLFVFSVHYGEKDLADDGDDDDNDYDGGGDESLAVDVEVVHNEETEPNVEAANKTTASVELEDGPEYRPHHKLSRGEEL